MVNNNKCNNPFNWSSLFTIFFRLDLRDKSVQEELKGKVFLSKLILLFQFCHLCLFPNPKVAVTQTGTMLSIVTECSKCGETDLMGRFPAGNLLLSFAVLCWSVYQKCALGVSAHGCVGFSWADVLLSPETSPHTIYWGILEKISKQIIGTFWETKRWYWLEMDLTIVWATQPNKRHLHNVLLYYRTHHPFIPCASMYVTLPSICLIDT